MAASYEEISDWFDRGKEAGYAYMIVMCDTFDHEDYPVYVVDTVECLDKCDPKKWGEMQRLMEVYDLQDNKAEQMAEVRAMRLPSNASKTHGEAI